MKKKYHQEKITFRTFFILFIILFGYFFLVIYLLQLQLFKGKIFTLLSNRNSCKIRLLYSPRGDILDRNNTVLVKNNLKFRVVLVNQEYKNIQTLVSNLQNCLDIRESLLKKK